MTVVALDDVWFGYGHATVLKGTSFDLHPGESVALLGRNGAGKTTVTRLIMALEHPNRGTVTVKGKDTHALGPADVAAHAAYAFQHPDQQLFARTVAMEVAFGPKQLGRSAADVASLVGESLRALGLEAKRDVHPYDLPPAERKLVTLAAALAQDPAVLVLDEPTQGLDRVQRDRVVAALREVAGRGAAVLAVTHDVSVVAEGLERSLALSEGVVAYDGPTADLLRDGALTAKLGLERPVPIRFSEALGLPGGAYRLRAAAAALAKHVART